MDKISGIVLPQPDEQSFPPITEPTVTACVQVKVLPLIVELNGAFTGSPLQMTSFEAEPAGNGFTVTFCVAVAVLPLPSVTVHTTAVVPTE